ncbi:hypothetical protein [Streptomyces sp. TRM70350]|uniref:rhamnogalacturonan lyase family protein n=1 Tax=Streptomyces sp. TRM70350 TaxID=2856165 RepID=UPI0035A98B61
MAVTAVNDNSTFMYSTCYGHGDALHVGDLIPARRGGPHRQIRHGRRNPPADRQRGGSQQRWDWRGNHLAHDGGHAVVDLRDARSDQPPPLHAAQYRVALAWQNTAYNQPPHRSCFLGDGVSNPTTAEYLRSLIHNTSLPRPAHGPQQQSRAPARGPATTESIDETQTRPHRLRHRLRHPAGRHGHDAGNHPRDGGAHPVRGRNRAGDL